MTDDRSAWRRVRALWMVALAADVIGYGILVVDHVTSPGDAYGYWLEPLIAAVFFYVVGFLIHRRYPRHRVGHAFLAGSLAGAAQTLAGAYAHFAIYAQPGLPLGPHAALVSLIAQFGFVVSLLALLLLYPNGRLVSPRWRVVVAALTAGVVLESLTTAFRSGRMDIGGVDNPLAWGAASDVLMSLDPVRTALLAIGVIGALASPIVRYRRSQGVERLQLRWFAFGATAGIILILTPLGDSDALGSVIWGVAPGLLPVSAGIAILRYRLYDLGLVVRRTVTYALVAGVLLAVYATAVLGLGAVGRAITGESGDLVVAGSTLLAAALFQPLRTRVQRAVDRRFDRRHGGARAIVDAFSRELRDQVDVSALGRELQVVARQATQPQAVSLWLAAPQSSVTVPER